MMAGKSSWNMGNAVLALVVDSSDSTCCLLPHIGILGAAIGWAVAILVANLVPLAQLVSRSGCTRSVGPACSRC